jgi:uncharacterized protein (TIGR02300 family)
MDVNPQLLDTVMATKESADLDIKAQRGTKRTCQIPECGSRFYDLKRDPITCPVCGTVYELAPPVPQPPPSTHAHRPQTRKPAAPPLGPKPEDAPGVEGDEPVAVEGDEETVEAEADDALIEEEDEDPNVAGIIDTPIDENSDEKS